MARTTESTVERVFLFIALEGSLPAKHCRVRRFRMGWPSLGDGGRGSGRCLGGGGVSSRGGGICWGGCGIKAKVAEETAPGG